MLWCTWAYRATAGARSVINRPERRTTKAAIVGELSLETESLAVIITEPLAVEDDLLDASAVDQRGLQVFLADDALDLALRQDTGKLGAVTSLRRTSPRTVDVRAVCVCQSVPATVVGDTEIDL